MEYEFKKQSKILGIERGYYFKGEFLSRYNTEAIAILRKRIEEAGNKVGDMSRTSWEKGREVCPDEWKVVHREWKKSTEKNKKTHEKKKPYYEKIHKRVLERKINTLKHKIDDVEARKKHYCLECDERIKEINKEIEQIGEAIK